MDTQISISVTDATPGSVRVSDVNCHLTCPVCKGYLIDATTITECLHSFCRSCVVAHVSEHHTCPSCTVPLSTTKPFSQLRRDYTLQTIVYKMVPRLARVELERRQRFAQQQQQHPDSSVNDERYLESFIGPDDPISLSLEYAEPNCAFGLTRFGVTDERCEGDEHGRRRYFRCPANLPVGHLIKFLRCKFNVLDATKHKLEILYNGHPLAAEYKLADVAYIFSWKENEPLRLWYRISTMNAIESAPVNVSPAKQPTPIKSAKRVRKIKKPLVDITCERNERSSKRRKRTAPADAAQPPPPHDEDDDVKLSSLVPSKLAASDADADEMNRPTIVKAEDNNNKADGAFEGAGHGEFTCSTPIPPEKEGDLKSKSTNWLPKAVFDLDDTDLFAKRLQKITESKSEVDKVKIITNKQVEDKVEPTSPSSPLNPLRICVTPEPSTAAGNDDDEDGANEVHDSVGALDLSASSKSDSETGAQQPSPGTSSTIKSPHPYFMTPMFADPARSATPLTASPKVPIKKPPMKFSPPPPPPTSTSTTNGNPVVVKSPLWNLINQVPNLMPPVNSEPVKNHQHKTLFDFIKSNPFLFRPNAAQKSPISKVSAAKLPSPKSV